MCLEQCSSCPKVFISYGCIGHFANKYGRRPVMLVLPFSLAISSAVMIFALHSDGFLSFASIAFSIFLTSLAGVMPFDLAANLYVADLSSEKQRSVVCEYSSNLHSR